MEERELVRRAKAGDGSAYEELVRRHQGLALRAASLIAGSDAEDAVQEAFVKAYLALGRFREDAPFRPWLLRIVTNEASNRRRAVRRLEGLTLRLTQDRASGDAAPSPEGAILEAADQQALLGALLTLAEPDRLVLGYRFLLELPEAETAQALGVRVGTVKSRTHRALARLRTAMRVEQ